MRIVALIIAAGVGLGACGGSDDSTEAPSIPRNTTDATTAQTASTPEDVPDEVSEPLGAGIGATQPCDRVTTEELSAAFDVTFPAGRQITDEQCLFDSGAPRNVQVLVAVFVNETGLSICEQVGQDYETVDIAGYPGWWDESSGQVRACLPDGSVAVTISGGGGDNSVHRTALLTLAAAAVGR